MVGLGARRMDDADAEVVHGAGGKRPHGVEVRGRVRGEPDDRVRAQEGARGERRGVGLPEVDPVHAGSAATRLHDRVEAVVHDEQRPPCDDLGQRAQLLHDRRVVGVLVAQLHDPHPAGDGRVDDRGHAPLPAERRIRDEVEREIVAAETGSTAGRHRLGCGLLRRGEDLRPDHAATPCPASTRARTARCSGRTAESASRSRTAKDPGPAAPSAASSAATV